MAVLREIGACDPKRSGADGSVLVIRNRETPNHRQPNGNPSGFLSTVVAGPLQTDESSLSCVRRSPAGPQSAIAMAAVIGMWALAMPSAGVSWSRVKAPVRSLMSSRRGSGVHVVTYEIL